MITKVLNIALDGNEANVTNRVGSNVYAFEILTNLEKISRDNLSLSFTVLLSSSPHDEFPAERQGWKYKVVLPKKLWTQWALPIHLFLNKNKYDVFFTPGHYAPRISTVPYISSVMDLAYLEYPEQFKKNDLMQLTEWTKYSIKKAKKIIAISKFTKNKIVEIYNKKPQDVVVAYPNIIFPEKSSHRLFKKFLKNNKIKQPYILYLGTIQPRKNLIKLIEAFEIFCRSEASKQLEVKRKNSKNTTKNQATQLVIAGKIGWLADDILKRISNSPFKKQIILPGFVPDSIKKSLYQKAECSVLVGLYEGFGIPPLESLSVGTIPIVSSTTSLPEVVGEAGIQVNPNHSRSIAKAFMEIWSATSKKKAFFKRKAKEQVAKFDWEKSARIVLNTIQEVAMEKS